jgi:hypothetical protein
MTQSTIKFIPAQLRWSATEAFDAMARFLTAFYHRTAADMHTLLADISRDNGDGKTADPAAWHDWLRAIREMKDSPPAPYPDVRSS